MVAPLGRGWGNQITAQRIVGHFQSAGYNVVLQDAAGFDVTAVNIERFGLFVVFHALRAGRHLASFPRQIKALLILGGN